MLVGDGYFVNYYTSTTSLFKAPDNDNDNVNVNIIKDLNVAGTVAPTSGEKAGILLDVVKANLNNVKTYGTITTAKITYNSFTAGGVAYEISSSANITNVSNFASFSNNSKSFNMAGIVYTATGTSWAGSVSNYGTIVGVRGDDGTGAGAAGGKGQDVYAIANTISSQNVNSANIYNYGVVKAGDGGNGRRGADDIGGSDLKDDQTTNWLEYDSITKSNWTFSPYYMFVLSPLADNANEYLYKDDNGYLTPTEEGIAYLLAESPLWAGWDDCYITSDELYFIKKNPSWLSWTGDATVVNKTGGAGGSPGTAYYYGNVSNSHTATEEEPYTISGALLTGTEGKDGARGNDGWGGINLIKYTSSINSKGTYDVWGSLWKINLNGNRNSNDDNISYITSTFSFDEPKAPANIDSCFDSNGNFAADAWGGPEGGLSGTWINIIYNNYKTAGYISWVEMRLHLGGAAGGDDRTLRSAYQAFYVTEGITSAICYDYSAVNSNTD